MQDCSRVYHLGKQTNKPLTLRLKRKPKNVEDALAYGLQWVHELIWEARPMTAMQSELLCMESSHRHEDPSATTAGHNEALVRHGDT